MKQSLRNFKLYPRTFKKKSVSLKLLDYTVIHVSTDSLFCKWQMAHFESLRTLLLESLILYVASNRMKVTSKKYQWVMVDWCGYLPEASLPQFHKWLLLQDNPWYPNNAFGNRKKILHLRWLIHFSYQEHEKSYVAEVFNRSKCTTQLSVKLLKNPYILYLPEHWLCWVTISKLTQSNGKSFPSIRH